MADTEDTTKEELQLLKKRADMMGVKYSPNIGLAKLRGKVSAKLEADGAETPDTDTKLENTPDSTPEVKQPVKSAGKRGKPMGKPIGLETKQQRHARLYREATKLVRVNITNMNPNKKSWPGEVYSVGNSTIGMVKKYILFNTVDGYHVPQIILNHMRERMCQSFTYHKDGRGNQITRSKLIKELAIEVLDPLTPKERSELAKRQALANNLGDE